MAKLIKRLILHGVVYTGSSTVYNVSTVLITLCNIMAIKMTSSSSVLSALAAAPSAIPSAAGGRQGYYDSDNDSRLTSRMYH